MVRAGRTPARGCSRGNQPQAGQRARRGGLRRRLLDEGELRHRRRAAAERPQRRSVARAGGCADTDVVVAIGFEKARLEEREVLEAGHPLPDLGLAVSLYLLVLPPIDYARQRVAAV